VRGSILSLWFVEPNYPDKLDQPDRPDLLHAPRHGRSQDSGSNLSLYIVGACHSRPGNFFESGIECNWKDFATPMPVSGSTLTLSENTTMVGHCRFSRINGTSRSVAWIEDDGTCIHGIRATDEYIVNPWSALRDRLPFGYREALVWG
jgi:hypothetical protein